MNQILTALLIVLYASFGLAATSLSTVTPSLTPNESVFTTGDNINGNEVLNNAGDVLLLFQNTDGSNSADVTVAIQNATVSIPGYGSVTQSAVTCNLAADEECVVGPFNPAFYNDGNSKLQISYTGDASAGISVIAIKP